MLDAELGPLVLELNARPGLGIQIANGRGLRGIFDAIDRAVERGKFWVFPGAHTQAGWRLRRFLPSLMWKIDHDAEGF